MIDYALTLYDQGIITIPVTLPDKKATFPWGEWYKQTPSREVFIEGWTKHPGQGIAVLCGAIELLEADVKNDPKKTIHHRLEQGLRDNMDEDLFGKLYIQQSPSGGVHFWYRVPEGEEHGNMPDLAILEYDDDDRFELCLPPETKKGVIVETRGMGGYALIWPSPGYTKIQGGIESLPVLTTDERDLMLMVGRMFNEYEPHIEINPTQVNRDYMPSGRGDRPGDVYNARTGPMELLSLVESYGFQRMRQMGENVFLKRPGQNRSGHAAKVNMRLNIFVNFSSSVPDFVPMKGYSPYYVYAYLRHKGNFAEATKDLAAKGFEDPSRASRPGYNPNQHSVMAYGDPDTVDPYAGMDVDDFLAQFDRFRFKIEERPNIQFNLYFRDPYKREILHPVAFPGALVAVYGKAKSRKTTVLGLIIAAALAGRPVLNVHYQDMGTILWVDTEQGSMFFWETMWRVYVQAGIEKNPDRLYSYCFSDMDPIERMTAVDKLVSFLNPTILVLDGIVDFMFDMNDIKETGKVIRMLRKWCATGCTCYAVLHLNKGKSNDARGHIGTFLTNKCDTAIEASPNPKDDSCVMVRNPQSRGPRFPAFDLFAGKDGILRIDAMPEYNFNIGKPERLNAPKEPDVVDTAPVNIGGVNDVMNRRSTFADEDIPF